jgi:hypothetical protein
MATQAFDSSETQAERPVLKPVPAAAQVCGDCRHHVPGATSAGCWCRLTREGLYGQPVTPELTACADFAGWPEGSPVPAFLAAMRL